MLNDSNKLNQILYDILNQTLCISQLKTETLFLLFIYERVSQPKELKGIDFSSHFLINKIISVDVFYMYMRTLYNEYEYTITVNKEAFFCKSYEDNLPSYEETCFSRWYESMQVIASN